MKNSQFNSNDVKTCCENKLDIQFRDGGELNGWYLLEGKKVRRVTVLKGRKELKPKTYKSMASQLGLSVEQFDNLLDCSLGGQDYQSLISAALSPRSAETPLT